MSAKILVSGLANTGKTSLLQTLTDVFIVAHDGKQYPFPQPHVNVNSFASIAKLISVTNAKLAAYKEKFGKLPATIVFDSVSTVFETVADNCGREYKSYEIWKTINSEINEFTRYIEQTLIPHGLNVVIVSHAVWNVDTATYELVAQGSFSKKGGFLSTVDNSIFIEVKNGKRIVHHRSPKFAARSLLTELPDSQPIEEYNLQKHVDMLVAAKNNVASYQL